MLFPWNYLIFQAEKPNATDLRPHQLKRKEIYLRNSMVVLRIERPVKVPLGSVNPAPLGGGGRLKIKLRLLPPPAPPSPLRELTLLASNHLIFIIKLLPLLLDAIIIPV